MKYSLIYLLVQCHVDPLNLVVLPDNETVTGDHEAEADKSNRPRHERPQDNDNSNFWALAERPPSPEHLHEPCDDRVLLVTAARQHVIRTEHIEHLQGGRGDREERDSDVQHCASSRSSSLLQATRNERIWALPRNPITGMACCAPPSRNRTGSPLPVS